jgi:hypothetical protein
MSISNKESSSGKFKLFPLSPRYLYSWLCTYPHLRILVRAKDHLWRKMGGSFSSATDNKDIFYQIKSKLLKIVYISLRALLAIIFIPIEALLYAYKKIKQL